MTANKRISIIIASIVIILLIPFTAMQFTDQVNWKLFDFIVAAGLLLGTGALIELAIRKIKKPEQRIALIIAILILLLLIWAELAVGIFGTAFAGN